MKFYSRKLLSSEELNCISKILKDGTWEQSETKNNTYLEGLQKNSELAQGNSKTEISKIVMNAVYRDQDFIDLVLPKQSTPVIVSRTETGQGFKPHHDFLGNGQFSTTVFLSEPDSYSGGELTLLVYGEERKFKLPAGHALTYEIDIAHCVKEVSRGVRFASVFWTTSLIDDPVKRGILYDLRKVKKLLPQNYTYDLEQTFNEPHFLIHGVENRLLRLFGLC